MTPAGSIPTLHLSVYGSGSVYGEGDVGGVQRGEVAVVVTGNRIRGLPFTPEVDGGGGGRATLLRMASKTGDNPLLWAALDRN